MMHHLKTLLFLGGLLGLGFAGWRMLLGAQARERMGLHHIVLVPIVAVGLFAPNLWIYYGAILLAMLVLPRSRLQAVGLYMALALALPLASHDVQAGSIYIARLEGPMVAALGLLAAFRFPAAGNDRGRSAGALGLVVGLFLLVQIVIDSRLATTSATTALRAALSVTLTLGVPYLLVSRGAARGQDIRQPLAFFAAVGFILSVVATYEMLRHWPLYQSIESHLGTGSGLSKTLALRGGLLRSPGPFFESTTFGVFLALSTICTAALRSIFRSPAAHLAAVGIGCLGCFATLSRNAWIGVLIGLVVTGLYRGRVGKVAAAGFVVAMAGAVLILATPGSGTTASLLGKGNTVAASTAEYRRNLISNSLPLIRNSPLIGTPYDRVRDVMQDTMTSGSLKVDYVNSYLYYLVTTGLVGLLVFLVFLLYPIQLLLRNRARLTGSVAERETAAALFAAQVALLFMVFGTSFFERIPLFAILLIAMTRLVVSHAGATVARPPAAAPTPLVIDPARPVLARPAAARVVRPG